MVRYHYLFALKLLTDHSTGAEIEEICDLAKDKIIERTMDNGDGILRVSDLEDVIKSTKSSITPEMLAVYETFAATAK